MYPAKTPSSSCPTCHAPDKHFRLRTQPLCAHCGRSAAILYRVSVTRRELPSDIAHILKRGSGVIDVATASAAGVDRQRLARLCRNGRLLRLAHGAYVSIEEYNDATPWEQYELKSRAYATSCAQFTFLAEWSAASVWNLPTIGEPPDLPVVIQHKARSTGSTTTERAHIRVANTPSDHWLLFGPENGLQIPIMSPAWTVLDLARTAPVHHALAAVDAALHAGEPVQETAPLFAHWEGARRMQWVLEHADERAESPIETLGRFTCILYRLPMPVTNAWIGETRPERRVDGLWPWHWVAHEADGAVKYDNRADASSVVTAEKEREWRIRRELGIDVVRYDAGLAFRQRKELAARFATVLANNPPRSEPIRWWKHERDRGPVTPEPFDNPSPEPTAIIMPAAWSRTVMY